MQLNRALVFLCLVIAVVSGAEKDHRVTCYLDVLTPRTHEGLCTHIVVPSAWTDEGLDLQSLSEDEYDTLEKTKGRNPTLKILLGLEVKEPRLALMFSNESSVENFIHTSLRYLKEKRFDGLDLTWVNGPISDESRNNYISFLKKLRGAFEEDARSSNDQTLLLSVCLCLCGFDMQELSQVVDFISVLPVQLEKDGVNINSTVQQWQDQQVDLKKLNLAMPAFLQRSRRRHHHHKSSTSNNDTDPEEGKKYHIHGMSLNLANQVCQAVKSGEMFITLTSISDEPSLVEQVSWLLQKGFGGVAVVFIDMDVFCNSVCDGITEEERVMVESKVIVHSHHGRRVDGHGDHHHRHSHGHHHQPRNHSQESHDNGDHRHRHHHHHRHGHHGHHRRGHHHHHHHHHHPHLTPQYNTSTEQQPGLE